MIRKFFGNNGSVERKLDHPSKLLTGDMITLKERSVLPADLQGHTLTVVGIAAYKYKDRLVTEYQLSSTSGKMYTAMYENEDGKEYITFSIKLSEKDVGLIFNLDEFGEVFDEDAVGLKLKPKDGLSDEFLSEWVPNHYVPLIRFGTAYYYDSDQREMELSEYADDGSEELQIHEFSGSTDDFSMSIEVSEDGETDVFLGFSFSLDLIDEMWPHG